MSRSEALSKGINSTRITLLYRADNRVRAKCYRLIRPVPGTRPRGCAASSRAIFSMLALLALGPLFGCGPEARTKILFSDIKDPAALIEVDLGGLTYGVPRGHVTWTDPSDPPSSESRVIPRFSVRSVRLDLPWGQIPLSHPLEGSQSRGIALDRLRVELDVISPNGPNSPVLGSVPNGAQKREFSDIGLTEFHSDGFGWQSFTYVPIQRNSEAAVPALIISCDASLGAAAPQACRARIEVRAGSLVATYYLHPEMLPRWRDIDSAVRKSLLALERTKS